MVIIIRGAGVHICILREQQPMSRGVLSTRSSVERDHMCAYIGVRINFIERRGLVVTCLVPHAVESFMNTKGKSKGVSGCVVFTLSPNTFFPERASSSLSHLSWGTRLGRILDRQHQLWNISTFSVIISHLCARRNGRQRSVPCMG